MADENASAFYIILVIVSMQQTMMTDYVSPTSRSSLLRSLQDKSSQAHNSNPYSRTLSAPWHPSATPETLPQLSQALDFCSPYSIPIDLYSTDNIEETLFTVLQSITLTEKEALTLSSRSNKTEPEIQFQSTTSWTGSGLIITS
ncbi:hypothetical protein CHS0354_006298 [Potamilus streckersoni]|uniref:Uncharacterized protein n=1 Tax=Potamilus streckersoni TaxID=2493646 RepID=A0AAE0S4M9_9BIVA|nr:hypothetical protein CHS0354_006298 [Potamilus streckersoni]